MLCFFAGLRKLWIHVTFFPAAEANNSENPLTFISKVTELIALKRLPHRKTSVSWVLKWKNDEDSQDASGADDEDDDDGNEEDNDEGWDIDQ